VDAAPPPVGGSGGEGGEGGAPADVGSGGREVGAADAAVAIDVSAPIDVRAADAGVDAAPASAVYVYAGSSGDVQIRIFQLDMATGRLTARGMAATDPSPDYLAFHPNKNYLYALSEETPGRVVAFYINPANGSLTRLNDRSSGGDGPAHISVHKSGRWLLSSNYQTGEAAALPIMMDGRLGPPVQPVRAGTFAHMIVDDGQSGSFVFVPSKGDNRVLQFRFDEMTGVLQPNMPAFIAQAGAPRHMVFHRNGRAAYLLTEAGRSIISYRYDAQTGLLSDPATITAGPMGDGAHIVLHPTKDLLYACVRFYDSVAVFGIDAEGHATAPRHFRDQVARPWDLAIDPTGTFMVVANNDTASIMVLRIDETGALSFVDRAAVAPRPRFVGILAL
jgi:6-phosphogluconolactonase